LGALDDELVAEAQDLTGLKERSALIREALIELESARRLARAGLESLAEPPSAGVWGRLTAQNHKRAARDGPLS
jgi:Bacterial antitoxin of type II TA system, VapB